MSISTLNLYKFVLVFFHNMFYSFWILLFESILCPFQSKDIFSSRKKFNRTDLIFCYRWDLLNKITHEFSGIYWTHYHNWIVIILIWMFFFFILNSLHFNIYKKFCAFLILYVIFFVWFPSYSKVIFSAISCRVLVLCSLLDHLTLLPFQNRLQSLKTVFNFPMLLFFCVSENL